jgi:hypothetical protein
MIRISFLPTVKFSRRQAGGHVTLEGEVDNQADRNAANIYANGVPGVFSVTNNLDVTGVEIAARSAKYDENMMFDAIV